jgi:predicted ribosome quality control (RQC) complex YloA/Tae2 family protein
VNASTLEKIKAELESELLGRSVGKIFQLSRFELAIDFRLTNSRYLFISFEPADPRIYLITRRMKDLDRSSGNPSPFALSMRKRLSGAAVESIHRLPGERVLDFTLSVDDEFGETHRYNLIAQLTGRSANLFLLGVNRSIIDAARETAREGQSIGDIYSPPSSDETTKTPEKKSDIAALVDAESPSEVLDQFYLEQKAEQRFQSLAKTARNRLNTEIAKREKLVGKLNADLVGHGTADKWKRIGDLLLANAATARRDGGKIFVTDYYDEATPEIGVEVDENSSITEAAENFFRKYTKARNAGGEIAIRLEKLRSELNALSQQKERLEVAIVQRDEGSLAEFASDQKRKPSEKPRGKPLETNNGARSFVSSDGFEILVGKKAKDNDFLTFRIAKSLDLWMHAADYPGSHVVVRNPNRKEIPQRTLLEAAQLAAFYSQGKSQPRAAVHYTQKKFVNKPKGAAAGLVSLASFKTILVVPEFPALPKS